jgi:hypothetical protein
MTPHEELVAALTVERFTRHQRTTVWAHTPGVTEPYAEPLLPVDNAVDEDPP